MGPKLFHKMRLTWQSGADEDRTERGPLLVLELCKPASLHQIMHRFTWSHPNALTSMFKITCYIARLATMKKEIYGCCHVLISFDKHRCWKFSQEWAFSVELLVMIYNLSVISGFSLAIGQDLPTTKKKYICGGLCVVWWDKWSKQSEFQLLQS
jgi:hypothetical protein